MPRALTVDALPEWRDDPAAPARARKAAWEGWMVEYEAWRAARRAWAERRGIDADMLEAREGNLIPDAPFDPSEV